MRQLFLRTVAFFRGQDSVVDFTFHHDAIYVANSTHDVLAPLVQGYPARCLLSMMDGREPTSPICRSGLQQRHPLRAKAMKHASSLLLAGLISPSVRLVYRFSKSYSPNYFIDALAVRPTLLIAGALGAHVPCWSDGKPGHKCSIEATSEDQHANFWGAAKRQLREGHANGLRALAYLTFPFGHPGGRYQNGNYSTWNERTASKVRQLALQVPQLPSVVVRYDHIVRNRSFASGVLAERKDTLHYMCITHGAGNTFLYPYEKMETVRTDKIRLQRKDGSQIDHAEVTCSKGVICWPSMRDACSDHVNLALVHDVLQALREALATAKFQDKGGRGAHINRTNDSTGTTSAQTR